MQLISVIIPTFNRAQCVARAIQSALDQTYKDVEIIVVDDGSTDRTAECIAKLGKHIKYVFKHNGGVSSARNFGIRESSGDFIAFLDSDDEWLPDKLEKQIKYLNNNPDIGMVLCDYFVINTERQRIGRSYRRESLPNDGCILRDVLMIPHLVPSSVLVKKNILDDIGSFDEGLKTAEDLDLHLRIALKYKIGLISEPLFNCMTGTEGLSTLSITYDDNVYVFERFVGLHQTEIGHHSARKALCKTYVAAANGKYWQKEWRVGFKYTCKATKCITSLSDIVKLLKLWAKCVKYSTFMR